jgi:OmpA-OmpF porin, OOP family
MKKNILIALLAAAALAPVAAQAESYVGVNAGRSEQKLTNDGYTGRTKDKASATKIYGGYQFSPIFGIEAGLANLGKVEDSESSARPRSIYVAATGTWQLKERLALFGKVGAVSTHTKIDELSTGPYTQKETGLMYGVGITYAFTPAVWAVAEYEDFGKIIKDDGVDLKATALTFGIRVKF